MKGKRVFVDYAILVLLVFMVGAVVIKPRLIPALIFVFFLFLCLEDKRKDLTERR